MLKYVRLVQGQAEAFVFGFAPLSHASLARVGEPHGWQAASAGFVAFGPVGATTHDRSLSLDLAPHPDDAAKMALFYEQLGEEVRALETLAARSKLRLG